MEFEKVLELMDRFQASGLSLLEWDQDGAHHLRMEQGESKGRFTASSGMEFSGDMESVLSIVSDDESKGEFQNKQKELQDDHSLLEPGSEEVAAPLVGVFYQSPKPGEPSFVSPGQKLKKGDVMCILEAMKIMNEISAPYDCIVQEVCVQDGDMVEVGKVLFHITKLEG